MDDAFPSLPSNWGVFGDDDELGTLNYLTPEVVTAAAREVVTGERYGLNLPLDQPHYFMRPTLEKRSLLHNFAYGSVVWNDDLVTFATQGSTQWDALTHVGLVEEGSDGVFYNGAPLESVDEDGYAHRSGIDVVARRGITARGVLVDVARFVADGADDPLPFDHRITVDEATRCLAAQGTEVRPGDVVCFRTGFVERLLALDPDAGAALMTREFLYDHGNPGIEPAFAHLAHEQRWTAIAADNFGVEVSPMADMARSLHVAALRNLGMPLGEFFVFDELSTACARDGRYSFLFVSVPLRIPGGAGSPADAMAVR